MKAGSEDNRATGNVGKALEETLKENQKQIPYRNSKITQLLSDSLGGTASALAVVCCAPEMEHILATHNSLEFAKNCCFIKNCVEVHEMKRKSYGRSLNDCDSLDSLSLPAPKRQHTDSSSSRAQKVVSVDEQDIEAVVMKVLAKQGMTGGGGGLAGGEGAGGERQSLSFEKDVKSIMRTMNTASLEDLQKLKFVGPSRAKKILKAREDGEFGKPMDLTRAGMSESMIKTIFQVGES
ncbi:Kinesin-like protein kif22 [Rhizophlyctis rosea]|nr:Kinesin-like protein kif22 [Rhizophlyctis rosea]